MSPAKAMYVRRAMVPVLYAAAPWPWGLVLCASSAEFRELLSISSGSLTPLALVMGASAGSGAAGLLHVRLLTRWHAGRPLVVSLGLGFVVPFVAMFALGVLWVLVSVAVSEPSVQPLVLSAAPCLTLVVAPHLYALLVMWFGIGAWWLMRPWLQLVGTVHQDGAVHAP